MINALNFFVFFALIVFLVVLFVFLNKHFQRKKILEGEKREKEIQEFIRTGQIKRAELMLIKDGRLTDAYKLFINNKDFANAAKIAIKMKNFRHAGELFERARFYEEASNCFLKIPDFRRAAQCLVIANKPIDAAKIYLNFGDFHSAAECFTEAKEYERASAIYEDLGNIEKAEQLKALALLNNGKYEEAGKYFEITGDFEKSAEVYLKGGLLSDAVRMYAKMEKYDKAAEISLQMGDMLATARYYEMAEDYHNASKIYKELNIYEKAIDTLSKAGDFFTAANLSFSMGKYDEAMKLLKIISPNDYNYGKACLLMGKILEERGDRESAKKYFSTFIDKISPTAKLLPFFEHLAEYFEREKEYDTALKSLKKIQELNLQDERIDNKISILEKLSLSVQKTMMGDLQAPAFQISEISKKSFEGEIPFHLLPRYEPKKKLGEGGSSIVFLATDRVLEREVVLKFLRNPSLPKEIAVQYFMREAKAIAAMSHPNIITIYDIGNVEESMFLAMEFLKGKSIEELIVREGKRFSLLEVADIVEPLADAIDYAHKKGIIHRDIKPSNIIILENGTPKLMDFGTAKMLYQDTGYSQYVCGTPDYMAPEQMAGEEVTKSADIYSFALLIYEMFFGFIPPLSEREKINIKENFFDEIGEVPTNVLQIIKKSLSIDSKMRPQRAHDISTVISMEAEKRKMNRIK